MTGSILRSLLLPGLLLTAAPVLAQDAAQPAAQPGTPPDEIELEVGEGVFTTFNVAVPPMPTPQATETPAGNTATLGRQVAEIIVADLRNSRLFQPNGPSGLPTPSFAQVSAPDYGLWAGRGAQNLIQG